MQNNENKILDTFLNIIGVKQSKGKTYLSTMLETFKEPHVPTAIIYQTVANIHNTTPQNVEHNIRYTRNKVRAPAIPQLFSRPPFSLTNKEFINELIIAYNNELKNPNSTIKEW